MGSRRDLRHKGKNPYILQRSTGNQCCVCRIRIDVDAILTCENTSKGVASVINVEVAVQSRGVVEYACHGQCGGNVCRAEDHVALSSTSSLCDCVSIALDLEDKTLELLNRPSSVGIGVEVESTSVSNVLLEHQTQHTL